MNYVCIGANRQRLKSIAYRLLDICNDGGAVEVRYEDARDNVTGEMVHLVFSNEDMEDRPDLNPQAVIIDHDLRDLGE